MMSNRPTNDDQQRPAGGGVPGPERSLSPHSRLDYVDGLRALAALYVILGHTIATVWNHGRVPEGWTQALLPWFPTAHFAVVVFIVLSGFCLMLPTLNRSDGRMFHLSGGTKSFFRRRAVRILPPYYFTLVISLCLIYSIIGAKTGTAWDLSVAPDWADIASHILMVHNVVGHIGSINYPLGTVALEWQIYLLFPALLWCCRRFGLLKSVVAALTLSYVAAHLLRMNVLAGLTVHFLGLFALGMLAAGIVMLPGGIWLATRGRRLLLTAGTALLAVGIVLANRLMPTHVERFLRWVDFPVAIVTIGLLILAAGNFHSRTRAALSLKPLVHLGERSYTVYLLHAPLLQVIYQYAIRPLGLSGNAEFLLIIGPGSVAIVAVSYLVHLVIERPFMTRRSTATHVATVLPERQLQLRQENPVPAAASETPLG